MSDRKGMHIDVTAGAKKKARLPKMTFKTPGTPPGTLITPTPTRSTPTPAKELLQLNIEMDRLHIGDNTFTIQNEDLVFRGMIGEGHFGIVDKMVYTKNDTQMAVKKIPLKDLRVSGNEILELDVIKKAKQCPFIVVFYGCLLRDGHVWICMELLDSSMGQVSDIVYKKLKQVIPEDVLGKMTVAVIKALHFLQKELQIIHRDVKPSNILVSVNGEFKLCDFGISGKLVDSIARTMDVGCRPYMAPERIDPARASLGYTIQSDVWSYGITLLELALGAFPYDKWSSIFDQLSAVVSGPAPGLPNDPEYSKELREFTSACLVKDPTKRLKYEHLQELSFFKKYNSGDIVDVKIWYQSIKKAVQ